ncbi:HlyD family efflux transporter periplasmic adaptor subunit [Ruminiclostridium herbifermentans]|uniref:HlyD family efflux transporter periplasmic adaptor subunit n=1 Tax=Ruminiclostridium herbifermentans TaxID=2488810 RepID=A0A4U7JCL0_9FIRM|nr:HlyD family efflux transporter periplasmic adaptor subunit [Ruminiclostridium herbifermentans]QNU67765.1 HlyD family efflux transporter periplasmic adaptor subunit [Ruminiclostridium herbifermentans]
MKDIIIDIDDLTDSREMYRSKPHSFVWVFTYIIIGLVIAAILWASFGKKEIVIKASGQVRPEVGIGTVNNNIAGEIESINYKQGMTVKAGDILYIIKHDNLLVEKEAYDTQLTDLRKELANLNMYRKSIVSGTNAFDKDSEPMYFEKVRKLMMDIHYTQTDTNYKITKLKEERRINSSQLSDYQTELACLKNYIRSLDESKNYLASNSEIEKRYIKKYENYIFSQKDIERKFDQQSDEINKNSFEALKQALEEERKLLDAYETLKKSVNVGENYFSVNDSYKTLYTDYIYELNTLKNTYDELKRVYESYEALSGAAISYSELENAKIQMQKAEGEYTVFKSNFLSDLDKTITQKKVRVAELESSVSGTLDKDRLLELNEKDKENALKRLYINERQVASDLMDSLTNKINLLRLNIELGEAELNTILDATGKNNINFSLVERLKSQEIIATDEKIKNTSDKIASIEQNIKRLQLDIDRAIVRANIDGVVNVISQIYKGDFVPSGREILTVIPDNNSSFIMQININNQDIGEINIGDAVKYSFAALPYREYGQITGRIISISQDSIIDKNSGQSFYIVEATVPNTKLYTKAGKQGDIKVGMLCEANIVTKQKSYLEYFLEKINFLE